MAGKRLSSWASDLQLIEQYRDAKNYRQAIHHAIVALRARRRLELRARAIRTALVYAAVYITTIAITVIIIIMEHRHA